MQCYEIIGTCECKFNLDNMFYYVYASTSRFHMPQEIVIFITKLRNNHMHIHIQTYTQHTHSYTHMQSHKADTLGMAYEVSLKASIGPSQWVLLTAY